MEIRKQTHLRDFEYKGDDKIYFITICTFKREPQFFGDNKARIIIDEFNFRISKKEINIYCYCIMPDHIHFLFRFTELYDKTLQNWISSFKRYTTRIFKERFNISKLWQTNFYEHVVRKDESLSKIAEYILFNPVRQGLVKEWSEYKYSKLFIE